MSPPASTLISATRDDGYYLSTDASKLDISRIYEWISTDCYWAIGRPFDVVLGSIENSLPVGVYTIDSAGNTHEQVAFARVVTDYCIPHQVNPDKKIPLPGSTTFMFRVVIVKGDCRISSSKR
jgi:hypothetical protein